MQCGQSIVMLLNDYFDTKTDIISHQESSYGHF
ncbi:hypothetical protein CPS_3037 [Colwellia psychrerythraea 34H]|uniref:Uncharacterized protein n=1 Tax=Colwellia psychrerythraea (strain 34H / ATCC BAA-681) TaxID=167879 RepID=Q47ZN4_COLP3|nr:hypothetical protein CPS_3037 [Colwellia psychrerythraea 34H]